MRTPLFGLMLLLGIGSCTAPAMDREAAVAEITTGMMAQRDAWNRGDLEGFMALYEHTDSLCFIGRNGPTYGWQPTLDRYRKGYPDRAAMGTLEFDRLRFRTLGTDHMLCTGRWQLFRTADTLSGHFTLILRHGPDGWRIRHDHSS